MSKAYLLVICLIATTFTGCLADDKTTDEKIEPVGMDDNEQKTGKNSTFDKNTTYSNITIRFAGEQSGHFANFSKMGNTVHLVLDSHTKFDNFIWFYDYNGNQIRHNQLYGGFDYCYSNGNWSAWDSNGSADCIETYELTDDHLLTNSTSVIWEFNLARQPMSVGIGSHPHYYWLDSF